MSTSTSPLPSDPAAEAALIAACLAWPERLYDVETVRPEDFYETKHRLIYGAMRAILARGTAPDRATIVSELTRAGHLEDAGGAKYLADLATRSPSAITEKNLLAYADRVVSAARLRSGILVGHDLVERAGAFDALAIEHAIRRLSEITEVGQEDSSLDAGGLMDALDAHYQRIETSGRLGAPTGFARLDESVLGLAPGDLILIGARPSMGKSLLAQNILEKVAYKNPLPALFFSIEMSEETVAARAVSAMTSIPLGTVMRGVMTREEKEKVRQARRRYAEDVNLRLDCKKNLTVEDVAVRARRLHRKHGGLSLIVIDYLQMMQATPGTRGRDMNRNLELSHTSRQLKILAGTLHVPIIALSQLNRIVEGRQDQRPVISDLRDSGSLEQDADLILLLYRDEFYRQDSRDKGVAEIIIAKQRNGPLATEKLAFRGECARFEDLADDFDFSTPEPPPPPDRYRYNGRGR